MSSSANQMTPCIAMPANVCAKVKPQILMSEATDLEGEIWYLEGPERKGASINDV